jgi:sugar diacid utilization regulator
MSSVAGPRPSGLSSGPGELQTIIDALAQRLHRAVAVDDPHLRLIVHTAHAHKVDRHRIASILTRRATEESAQHSFRQGISNATGPVRVPSVPGMEHLGRLCIPVRCLDLLLGYLWLIDDEETLTEPEIRLATDAASAVGEALLRERLHEQERSERDRELLRDLLASAPDLRHHAADDLVASYRLPSFAHVCVLVAQVQADVAGSISVGLDAALQEARAHALPLPSLATTQAGGRGVLLLAADAGKVEAEAMAAAGTLLASLERYDTDGLRVQVCIGPGVSAALEAHRSYQMALTTLRVVAAVGGFPQVARWDDLGVFKTLSCLPLDQLPPEAIPEGLRKLLRSDLELVETLETYLDLGGNVPETISKLYVHRTTLYARIRKIEQVTGMKLADGTDRLMLHLGLKLARLSGQGQIHLAAPGASVASGQPPSAVHHQGMTGDVRGFPAGQVQERGRYVPGVADAANRGEFRLAGHGFGAERVHRIERLRGGDDARRHAVDRDPGRAQLDCQVVDQRVYGALAHGVAGVPGPCLQRPRDRRRRQEPAVLRSAHVPDGRLETSPHPAQVHVQDEIGSGLRHALGCLLDPGDGRVRHHDLQAAQLPHGLVDRRVDAGPVPYVQFEGEDPCAQLGGPRRDRRYLVTVRRIPRQGQVGAGGREDLGRRGSDPGSRPGDESDLGIKREHPGHAAFHQSITSPPLGPSVWPA